MSIISWGFYEVAWPKDTQIDRSNLNDDEPEELGEGRCFVFREFWNLYSDHILDEVVEMFGRPLDEVEGLELHCGFSCMDDKYFECRLDILDGEVTYDEAELMFVQKPLSECPIDIGR